MISDIIHCGMITTTKLTHPSPRRITCFVCVVRTLKVYSLSKFQVYIMVSLTIITMLYNGSSELIHLINENLYPLTNISPLFPSPWQPPVYSLILWIWFFLIPSICEIIHYLSFCVWLISLSILPSSFIRVVTNGRIPFLWLNNIHIYISNIYIYTM